MRDDTIGAGIGEPAGAQRRPSELARLGEVRRVGRERAEQVNAVLSDAFVADPLFAWLFAGADDSERRRHLNTWWGFMLAHPPAGAEVHVSGDGAAAAVWHPPGCKPHAPPVVAAFTAMVEGLLGERAPQALVAFGRIARCAPRAPHWHLAAVGVEPAQQGRGLGARVLAPMLARCDRHGTGAYLESSNPRNLAFYRRLGFRRTGEVHTGSIGPPPAHSAAGAHTSAARTGPAGAVAATEDEDGVSLTLMWRPPQPRQ